MDWLQFISTIFGHVMSLAWPGAVVLIAYLYRERLMELLPSLQVKRGELELSFRLDKAEEAAADVEIDTPIKPELQPTPEEKSRFEEVARLSPAAAILGAKREVEDLLIQQAAGLKSVEPSKLNMLAATRVLRSAGVINRGISEIIDELRIVGTAVEHDPSRKVTPEEARRYASLAGVVMNWLLERSVVVDG